MLVSSNSLALAFSEVCVRYRGAPEVDVALNLLDLRLDAHLLQQGLHMETDSHVQDTFHLYKHSKCGRGL